MEASSGVRQRGQMPKFSKLKILVTGGAGFIGTHLCRALVHEGHAVTVLDIVSTREIVPSVKYLQGDVRDLVSVENALADSDAVFHLAAMVSVPLCQDQPAQSYQTNLIGTANVLEAVRKQGKKTRVVFASSAAVYGHSGDRPEPVSESRPLAAPLSFYAAQKLASEQMLALYHKTHQIPAVVFRFFNVFGPGQDPSSPYSGVISIFASQILGDAPIQLNGGGAMTRDFVSVHDIVRALLKALDLSEPKCDGCPINLGSGLSTSIRELAKIMMRAAGRKVELVEAPARFGDIQHSLADISRARDVLGWTPQTTLESGLNELFRSCRS